jgi:cephalosporin hydroxylase
VRRLNPVSWCSTSQDSCDAQMGRGWGKISSRLRGLPDKIARYWRLEVLRRLGMIAFDRHTGNVSSVLWLGQPIRQNPFDIWTIQEIIVERGVDFVVETGTLQGGSAYFMATLFDSLGRGHVATIDVTSSSERPAHPRITYVHGSSTSPVVRERVDALIRDHVAQEILVILDSDHHASHVLAELQTYSDLISVGGYLVVQDGIVDEIPLFKDHRPGPLHAIAQFLQEDSRFEVDQVRSLKFLFHYSPRGCLRRIR